LHRLSIHDALQDGPALVRSLDIFPALSKLTRQEIYDLKDQGKLDLKAVLAELCAPVDEKSITDFVVCA
jgi:hypothetical protein